MRGATKVGRAGFTLVEILVTLLLIGLLVGVVLPSVLSQSEKGENQRVIDDVEAIRSATKLFRLDVQRWPGALDQLVVASTGAWSTTNDLSGNAIPGGLLNKWGGPYLELGDLPGDTLVTALGGSVQTAFSTTSWGGTDFLTIQVNHIPQANAEAISELVDGDTDVSSSADSGGRVRWVSGTPNYLLYLAAPIN